MKPGPLLAISTWCAALSLSTPSVGESADAASHQDRGDVSYVAYARQALLAQFGDDVLAGGAGGGVGIELTWRERYLAAADANVWWLLGNAVSTRMAVGMQRAGSYAPAGWVGAHLLFGDRLELLGSDGSRPPSPRLALGLRGAPLRFSGRFGNASLLEPGVLLDVAGGWHLDLTVLQVGGRF